MSQEWMIQVLRDLRSFAAENGMHGLAEQLDDTIHVATSEVTAVFGPGMAGRPAPPPPQRPEGPGERR